MNRIDLVLAVVAVPVFAVILRTDVLDGLILLAIFIGTLLPWRRPRR